MQTSGAACDELQCQPGKEVLFGAQPGSGHAFERDDQDWQFAPEEFEKISRRVGGFTLDAACDAAGSNRLVQNFCSERRSFLRQKLAG